MGFCGNCGFKNVDGAKFCNSCGSPSGETNGAGGQIEGRPAGGAPLERAKSKTVSNSSGAIAAISSAPTSKQSELSPIIDELKKFYRTKILPMEQLYKFEEFHSPSLTDTDFDAKPMVLLIGQYSTGKTTFIKYILERDFPGAHIGPEPTTDRFMAVMYGKDERIIPGNALAADASKPFTALNKFGMGFLNKFECSQVNSKILEKISFVDTPGVLSGEKQRIGRSYNFSEIVEWFAERADRILLLFDAHKLDISDEFKGAIEVLKGHDDKIRVILNKADIPVQNLMRVYGALMWSLGKVIKTPEVLRVYIGSFSSEHTLVNIENARLLQAEQLDLLADLRSLPRNSTVRRINELVKRARLVKTHACIVNHMRNQFGMFGKEKKQSKMLENLVDEFKSVQSQYNIPVGDFPSVSRFKEIIARFEIAKFPKLDPKQLKLMDDVLAFDIPNLMRILPGAEEKQRIADVAALRAMGGDESKDENPFKIREEDAPVLGTWTVTRTMKTRYDTEFYAMDLTADNKATGMQVKKILLKSKLEPRILKQVWDLSDIDRDGLLDHEEFAVAMYLVEQMAAGAMQELPSILPDEIMPPSRRQIKD